MMIIIEKCWSKPYPINLAETGHLTDEQRKKDKRTNNDLQNTTQKTN
jgi:hypothetical protein